MKKNYPIQEKTVRKGCLVVQMSDVSFLSGQPKVWCRNFIINNINIIYNKNKFLLFSTVGCV